jgi:hypothetical protein
MRVLAAREGEVQDAFDRKVIHEAGVALEQRPILYPCLPAPDLAWKVARWGPAFVIL